MKVILGLIILLCFLPQNASAQSDEGEFFSGITSTMVLVAGAVSGGLTTTQLTKDDVNKEEIKVRKITLFLKRNHVAFLADLQIGDGQLFDDFYRLLELAPDEQRLMGKRLRLERDHIETFALDATIQKTTQLIRWIERQRT